MTSSKSTKRALVSSALATLVCIAMLIATTFAWFTDTASTAVNKIQSGKLDVALEMKNDAGVWENAEGKTLNFLQKQADETVVQKANILWEPGCTYELPELRVVNNGNLALKYKILITGIKGNVKLNEAIDWTIKLDNTDFAVGSEHSLAAKNGNTVDADILTIKGHMKETAGNGYMNMSIDGIGITVYATQDTVENDSQGNQYDINATYYPVIDFAGLKGALSVGGNVTVKADISTDGADNTSARTVIKNPTTLNLDKKIISPDNMGNNGTNFAALYVSADTIINAGEDGGIDTGVNGAYGINVINGAKLIINGGYYYGGGTAVQVQKGELTINGGFFAVEPFGGSYGYNFLINCIDGAYRNGTAKVAVKGGTFVNFNPADCKAEGEHTNFVADGYSVITQTKANGDVWYTVVKGTGVVPGTQEDLNNGLSGASKKDVTVVMPSDSTFTLDNGIANDGNKSRKVTFVGDGSQTVDVASKATTAEGARHLNYQRGSTFTFENITVVNGEDTYDGIVCSELIYKNCVIKGVTTLYGKATFINCVFENNMPDQYSIWTWGGTDVKFEGCTFNTNGKAILLFGEDKTTDLTVNNCIFNDRRNGSSGKAAVEIGDANYGKHNNFTVVINNAVVNGHANGKNTGTNLWANKNNMDAAHLSVTVDGNKVH